MEYRVWIVKENGKEQNSGLFADKEGAIEWGKEYHQDFPHRWVRVRGEQVAMWPLNTVWSSADEEEDWRCGNCDTSYKMSELEPEVNSYIGPLCDACSDKG